MFPPLFIVGPTAVGKTGIALEIAASWGGEIVSADAFQVYEGLDLLSAKPSLEELSKVPHHLISSVSPAESYSAARYLHEARGCLDDIARRGHRAIVVGGSGMYVKALTHGLDPLPPAHMALRSELDALELQTLQDRLRVLDPPAAAVIDLKNKRRLVRALEVCIMTGRRFSEFRVEWRSPSIVNLAPEGIFLVREKPDLHARIKRRVEWMFAHDVVEEVRKVATQQVGDTASRMIGWNEIQTLLRGKMSVSDCMSKIEIATRQYAKRQMTWFRGQSTFTEVPLFKDDDPATVAKQLCERLPQTRS